MSVRFKIPEASQSDAPTPLIRLVQVRDRFTCVYCGARHVPLEVDHVRPKAHFALSAPGEDVHRPRNLATACAVCNASKGPQNLDGFSAMLRGRGVPSKVVDAMRRRVRNALRRPLPLAIIP